jgi:hypothetical protein
MSHHGQRRGRAVAAAVARSIPRRCAVAAALTHEYAGKSGSNSPSYPLAHAANSRRHTVEAGQRERCAQTGPTVCEPAADEGVRLRSSQAQRCGLAVHLRFQVVVCWMRDYRH